MKTTKFLTKKIAQTVLLISLLVLIILQYSVIDASANKDVYVRWGTSNTWKGEGGSVASSGYVVSNKGKTAFSNWAEPVFVITPLTGYVIASVEWKNDDSNGFNVGTGTKLEPDSDNQVTFKMNNKDCSLQVLFKVDPDAATDSFLSYYGTGAIDPTGATSPDWIGGGVQRWNGSKWETIGTSSYTVVKYPNDGNKRVKITPDTSPAYTVAAVKYCQANWKDPRSVTVNEGTCVSLSYDLNAGEIIVPAESPKNYIVFVQFAKIGAVGGNIGAWYGTNNTTGYNNPVADGSGGEVWKTLPGSSVKFKNAVADDVFVSTNSPVTIEVRPNLNFKITSISYGDTVPSNTVLVPANQTSKMSFTFPVSAGHSYVVWVVFTSTSASNFTVSGTVDPTTDALCTSNSISPPSKVIDKDSTGSFSLSTSSNCVIESVNYNGEGSQPWVGTSTTYTTPPITATSSFVVKFKPIGFNILAEIDASSPSGCGTISPSGTNNYVRASDQTFLITKSDSCTISHVWVTDANKGFTTDTDIAPLQISSYTFTDIQAAGHIKVAFTAIVPALSDAYCQIPPFVAGQAGLAPNVLIVFDNSGSMGGSDSDGYTYYKLRPYGCTSSDTISTLGSANCAKFDGYFDPTKMYVTDTGNSNRYLIKNVTLNLDSSSGLSGNYLNYRNMHKVDIVRKVLMGGKVVDRTASNYFLSTDTGKTVEYGTTLPSGIIQTLSGRVRLGLMVFNNPSEGGHLAKIPNDSGGWTSRVAELGSSEADLVAAIESTETDPLTGTPTSETLYEAIRYFQAKPSAYNKDIDYSTMDPVQNSCQKHFVLLLTDGEPNSNNNLPGLNTKPTMNGYTDSVLNVKTWENMIPVDDRATNINKSCSAAAYGASTTNTEYVEAVAFYMHNTDLRSDDYGNNVDGAQNITLFPVYAFGSGAGIKTLQMAAKYGGYENTNGNTPTPNTWASPDLQAEWDKSSDPKTCTPYNYYQADDSEALASSIRSAFSSILAKVASGTAASILSNSEGSGANMLQAVFFPSKIFDEVKTAASEVKWTGEMQNLWYYVDPFISNSTVREDTDFATTSPYHILDLRKDYALRFYFINSGTLSGTYAETSKDTNGDGTGDLIVNSAVSTDDVKSIWKAGRLLWSQSASARTIHTSIDGYSLFEPTNTGGGFDPSNANAADLQPYLQVANNDSNAEAQKVISYIRGTDQSGYRGRKATLKIDNGSQLTSEWKLGDIVASTPRLQSTNKLNIYDQDAPSGYNDKSYKVFSNSAGYKARGMVYVGANDGMLHAFKLGKLSVTGATDVPVTPATTPATKVNITGDVKATLSGSNLGAEQWSYIPRSVLPYLKYFTDSNYKHLFYVDGPTVLSDISVVKPSACVASDYSECVKDSVGGTNWSTVLIGSMGLGGASRLKGTSTCLEDVNGTCVKSPIYDPEDNGTTKTMGVGYSSYFALDVTGQHFKSDGTLANQPTLKWEFPPAGASSDFGLGFATSGAAIVRISAKKTDPNDSTKTIGDPTKNGKWFAVFASGSTGPIDNSLHRFMGKSDQNLKIFVVDLGATIDVTHPFTLGTNYWVIDTQIKRAFGGSILSATIDTDRWNATSSGNYQDDALYVGYTKANIADSAAITSATTWTNGGVIRILTKEDTNPNNWVTSPVISGIGPVTTAVAKLQDRKNKKLWLYFGTGRFYFGGDDSTNQRYIMGVQDRCYTNSNSIDKNCDTTSTASINPEATGKGSALGLSDLSLQTTINASDLATKKGWYIALDGEDVTANLAAERNITDSVALTNGAVFFTTFKPTSDVCKFGGDSYMWGTKYDTGGVAPAASLTGKALVQVSTGAFEEITLGTALTAAEGRKMGSPMTGKPPSDAPPVVSNSANKPSKKIIHLQEK